MHATGNFFSRVFMRWTKRSNDHRVPLSHVLVRRSRFACRTTVWSILHGWGCSTFEVWMTFLSNSFYLCFIALRYKNVIFNVSEPNCTTCELVMAIYEGITIKREWVARTGNCKMKKRENRRWRYWQGYGLNYLLFPFFFYFPIHWARFRSSFLVLVLSVAMPVNTGSTLDPVVYSIFHICFPRFLPRTIKKRPR